MEVLRSENLNLGEETLAGHKLVQAVTTLSDLPPEWAHQEIRRILEHSEHGGQISDELTLDQLRAAMVAYLESLQDSLQFEENE